MWKVLTSITGQKHVYFIEVKALITTCFDKLKSLSNNVSDITLAVLQQVLKPNLKMYL